jgi:hypothetical protein
MQNKILCLLVTLNALPLVVTNLAADQIIAVQNAKLVADDGAANDIFGHSVCVSGNGNTAIVGAYTADIPGRTNAGSAYVFVRSGTNWTQQAKLNAADAAGSDLFGCSVALSADGNTALVGAYGAPTAAGANAGSAYVFVRGAGVWSQQAKLTCSDAVASQYLGISVSLSDEGDTALVGAHGGGAGSAYVFARSGGSWSQQWKMIAADGATMDRFGAAVSLSGDGSAAIVGAPNDDTSAGADAGSAYVFVRSGATWSQQAKLTANDAAMMDQFGSAVKVDGSGSTALVGAPLGDTPSGANAGSAYVFVRSGTSWSQQAKLTAADAELSDQFGYSVGLSSDGNLALLGVPGDDVDFVNAGSAYAFARTGTNWVQQVRLTANDQGWQDGLGWSVSLSGDGKVALAGARTDDTPQGADAGSAYVFSILTVSDDYNRLTAERLAGGSVRLRYLGLSGMNYALDRTFDLTPFVYWEPQETNAAAPNGYVILTNTPEPTMNSFWRMRSVP